MYNPNGDIIQEKSNTLFNKIILGLSIILITFLISIPCFAQNRIDYGVSQQDMLKVVYNYIHGTNTLVGGQYSCRVFCSPLVFLDAGNCYIDWHEYRYVPHNKETAYQEAVQRYSLTAHTGTYDIEYENNKVVIRLSDRNNYNPRFYTGLPSPTQQQYSLGGVQIPTSFEYHMPYSNTYYSSWYYISSQPDYWNNCKIKKQELERQGFIVERYYPSNGMQDLRNYYIPGPTG